MVLSPVALGQSEQHANETGLTDCPTYRLLSPKLQVQVSDQPHLWEYIHSLPVEQIGVPQYFEVLSRNAKDMPKANIIYPVAAGVYIHIYPDPSDSRDYYIAIEPGMDEDMAPLMEAMESRLIDFLHELTQGDDSAQDRRDILLRLLDKVCTVRDGARRAKSASGSKGQNAQPSSNGKGKLTITKKQREALRYLLLRDKEGVGTLQPLIEDPYIEDISCSGAGPIFVEHKIFSSLKAGINFPSMEKLDTFVIRLSEKIGKPVTFRDPVVDATLPDGSRINIVYGSDLSKRGSNFTIRKFAATPMSILELIEGGSLSNEIGAYLSLIIGEGMNLFVSGETASGKTTLLNALTTFIPPSGKIVSIEDTPELQCPHSNWIREVVRGSTKTSSGSAVTMFDLLKAALRQRPNEIIIGEIRGEEGAIAFQAMQTGHACMATFHASTVEKLIQRLTGNPINVPKTYIDNLNVVVIQAAVRLPSGKTGRRVLSVNEIIGYDSASDSFSFIEVFRWDPVQDRFEFTGFMNSFLLEHRIALKRGIPAAQRRKIYDTLKSRVNVLQKLRDQKVMNFHDVYKVLAQAYRQGLFR